MAKIVAFFLAASAVTVESGSPVQKVVELLAQCKAKVLADLDQETKAMQEFSAFCDSEAKEKSHGITTAGSAMEDLAATIEDATATIATCDDEVSTLGTVIAGKEKELTDAQSVRNEDHGNFISAEKELIESVDQLGRAASVLKKGASLAQMRGGKFHVSKQTKSAINALKVIVESQWVDAGSRKALQSFLQAKAASESEEDDDLSEAQPEEDEGGASVVQTVEDMQGKAEDTLSELRKKEMEASNAFQLVESGLVDETENNKAKLAATSKAKSDAEQKLQEAKGENVETSKSKIADEESLETLKSECQQKAVEYEEMMKSGKEEVGAIEKASSILSDGVTAFIQLKSRTRRSTEVVAEDDDDESDAIAEARSKVVEIFKGLAERRHSYVFSQLASMASSDPFEKIKGLINDMVEKLLKEAQDEATHEAFCQEEMGKAKKSQDIKEMKLSKFTSRVDEASSKLAELQQGIKSLVAELSEIDMATAESTSLRGKEHDEFLKASKDYKDSASAIAQAIEVLQSFYNGASFVQLKSQTSSRSKAKVRARARATESGSGDAAGVIIGVLESSQEDFTNLLAEAEAAESEAQAAFDKMATESKVGKATKQTEVKAMESQVKSVSASLEMSKEDQASTGKELDAVLAYLDKLKPECETKAMSYEEKKAARESEIDGLKEALDILSGKGIALMQTGSHLRRIRA